MSVRRGQRAKIDGVTATVVAPKHATIDRVTTAVNGMRQRGAETMEDVLRRYIHQAVYHRVGGWSINESNPRIAARIGIDYKGKFKNYKHSRFESHRFEMSPTLQTVAEDVAQRLGVELTDEMLAVLVK
jgi:hypothetical protein